MSANDDPFQDFTDTRKIAWPRNRWGSRVARREFINRTVWGRMPKAGRGSTWERYRDERRRALGEYYRRVA